MNHSENVACVQVAHVYYQLVDEQALEPSYMEVFISQTLADSIRQQADANRPAILAHHPLLDTQPKNAFYLYTLAHALKDVPQTQGYSKRYRLESIAITHGANEGCRLEFTSMGGVRYTAPMVH